MAYQVCSRVHWRQARLDSNNNALRLNGFTVGAQYLLLDRFQLDSLPIKASDSHSRRRRVSLSAAVRRFTGNSAPCRMAAVPAELRSTMDVVAGRFGATFAARFVKSLARSYEGPVPATLPHSDYAVLVSHGHRWNRHRRRCNAALLFRRMVRARHALRLRARGATSFDLSAPTVTM